MTDFSSGCTSRFWFEELMKDLDSSNSSNSDDEYDIDEQNILSLQHPKTRNFNSVGVVQSKSVFKSTSLASSSSITATIPIEGELPWSTSCHDHGTCINAPTSSKDNDAETTLSLTSRNCLPDSTEQEQQLQQQRYVARPTLSVSLYSGTIPSMSSSSSVKTVPDETEDDNIDDNIADDDDDLMVETTEASVIEVDVDGSDCRIDDSERVSNQPLSESDHPESHCSVIDPSYQLLAMIGSYDDDHDDELFTTTRWNNIQKDNNNYQNRCNMYHDKNNPKDVGFRCYIFQDDEDDFDSDVVDNLHALETEDIADNNDRDLLASEYYYQYTTFPTPSSVANDCAIACMDSNHHSKTDKDQKQRMTIKSTIYSAMRKLLQATSSTTQVTTTNKGTYNTTPMNVTASSFHTLLQAIHDNYMDGTHSNDIGCHHTSSTSTIMEVSTSSDHDNNNDDEKVNWNDHSFCITESTDSSSCCSSSTSSSSSYRACEKNISSSSSNAVAGDETTSGELSDNVSTPKTPSIDNIVDGSIVSLANDISNDSISINHQEHRCRKSPLLLPYYYHHHHPNFYCCCDVQYDDWYYRNVIRTMYHVACQLSSVLPQKSKQLYYYD